VTLVAVALYLVIGVVSSRTRSPPRSCQALPESIASGDWPTPLSALLNRSKTARSSRIYRRALEGDLQRPLIPSTAVLDEAKPRRIFCPRKGKDDG
jgi:hypothetical protein